MYLFNILLLLYLNAVSSNGVNSHEEYEKFDFVLPVEDVEYAAPLPCKEFCGDGVREKRLSGYTSTMKSKILDVMLATKTFHISPAEPDVFAFLRDQYELPKEFKGPLAEYDFIVIGAGSAGSVLASRLSEGRKASVLLLEAGRGESVFTAIPVLAPLLQQTDYVWHYLMEYQPGICTGMTDGRCFWPRGKAVGGSSVVNYMIYTRGQKEDWDRVSADGNYGWSYDQVLPYYIKSERAVLRGLERSPYHGRNGDLNVEYVPFKSRLAKAFLDAAQSLGHRKVDYNSPDGFGFSYIQATLTKGRRVSSARAFLHDHKKRKNLHVLSSTRATKILIDPETKTATGVQFHRNGRKYEVRAKKEVLLSAGPIESPHLLMLSGIGPSEQLLPFDIPVIHDLRVGQSLYDHIAFPGLTFTVNTSNITLLEKNVATIRNAIQFDHYGDGPMSSLGGVETIGYIKTNISEEKGDYPDIELLGTCASIASDNGNLIAKGIHMADWLYNDVYKRLENQEAFTILFMLLHPESKGYLRLQSKNPFDDLKMYGNYLTSTKDTATTVAAIRYIIKMVETAPFQKYGAKLDTKKFPNCKSYNFGSDGYWECAVRTLTTTLHHQIATCKMGPKSDPEAVVDPELRVHGVRNLRVVDSSIIPRTMAAHTNAPAIMIGEKAADMIKATWKLY